MKVSKDSKGKLSISVKENKEPKARSGVIVLKSYDGGLCQIKVTQSGKPIPVSSVSFYRKSVSIDIGETVILWEKILPENASNKRVEWESSDETIAKVSPNGIVRGLKQGIATITVKTCDGGKTAKCKVTVKPPSISVTPAYVTLYVDDTTTLDVEPTPSYYGYSSVKWSRSFSLFPAAKVDSNGKVTALRPGKTVITAKTNDGRKSTCMVTVVKGTEITSISIEPKSITIFEEDTLQLKYEVSPPDAKNKKLKWSSSDPSIATVDSNGRITGIKGGIKDKPCKVTITATAQDGSGKKATCKVEVKSLIRFDNVPVYLTKTQIKSYGGEDIKSDDKDPEYFVEHTIYNCQKQENEEGEYYYTGDITKSDSSLFNDMKGLKDLGLDLSSEFNEMAERFHNQTGGTYQNANLTKAVKNNKSTLIYCKCVEKNLKEVIKESKGDLTKLDYSSYSNRQKVPLVQKMTISKNNKEKGWNLPNYTDMTKGLGITIHSWISNNIYVDDFVMNANGDYSCTVRYEFYDVFGLDTGDVEGTNGQEPYGKKFFLGQKFRAWYILQHLKNYSDTNGYKSFKGKPFTTKVVFTRSLSGKI